MPDSKVTLASLGVIPPEDIIALHTDPDVLRHLPLAPAGFDLTAYEAWIEIKQRQWTDNGFGPWAVLIDGRFAGWGGFQLEGDDADLALVMFPRFWGCGGAVARHMIQSGFADLGLRRISALLPASRTRTTGMARLGFRPDGERSIDGHRFARFVMDLESGRKA